MTNLSTDLDRAALATRPVDGQPDRACLAFAELLD
jgi:hypothetical protein